MASTMLVDVLRQVAIFRTLKPRQIEELAHHTERVKFAEGDAITRAGTAGDGAFILVSGVAECLPTTGTDPALSVQPGSIIGQLAMLVEHFYGSTVVARERVFCLKVTRAGLHAQMAHDPSLAHHLEQHITSHLKTVARQLREIDSILQARRHGMLTRQFPALDGPTAQPLLAERARIA